MEDGFQFEDVDVHQVFGGCAAPPGPEQSRVGREGLTTWSDRAPNLAGMHLSPAPLDGAPFEKGC